MWRDFSSVSPGTEGAEGPRGLWELQPVHPSAVLVAVRALKIVSALGVEVTVSPSDVVVTMWVSSGHGAVPVPPCASLRLANVTLAALGNTTRTHFSTHFPDVDF